MHTRARVLKKGTTAPNAMLIACLWFAIIAMFLILVTMIYGGFGRAMIDFQSLGKRVVNVINIYQNKDIIAETIETEYAPCDLDRSGACDDSDADVFKTALFTCNKEVGYLAAADVNGDGCVRGDDLQQLFP